jgi:hypothetical protein
MHAFRRDLDRVFDGPAASDDRDPIGAGRQVADFEMAAQVGDRGVSG